jgi:hypothetical protein
MRASARSAAKFPSRPVNNGRDTRGQYRGRHDARYSFGIGPAERWRVRTMIWNALGVLVHSKGEEPSNGKGEEPSNGKGEEPSNGKGEEPSNGKESLLRVFLVNVPAWIIAITGLAAFVAGYGLRSAVQNSALATPPCVLPSGSGAAICLDTPTTGEQVGRYFTVAGKLANVAADSHVWVATEVGNLVFPKAPEVPIGAAFNVMVVEGGNPPGGKFSIVVLLVSNEGERVIHAWLSKPGQPGLSLSDNRDSMTVLATVADLGL